MTRVKVTNETDAINLYGTCKAASWQLVSTQENHHDEDYEASIDCNGNCMSVGDLHDRSTRASAF